MSTVAYSVRRPLNLIFPGVLRRSENTPSFTPDAQGRFQMMRLLARAVLLSAVCAVFVACGKNSPTGPEAAPSDRILRSTQTSTNAEPPQFDPTAATTDSTSAVNRGGFIGSGH
jgi:hypothetical protein